MDRHQEMFVYQDARPFWSTLGWRLRLLLEDRNTKEKFRKCVSQALNQELMTIERVRAAARHARAYIRSYHHLANMHDEEAVPERFVDIQRIAKLLRSHKTHRSAEGCDTKFCDDLYSMECGYFHSYTT